MLEIPQSFITVKEAVEVNVLCCFVAVNTHTAATDALRIFISATKYDLCRSLVASALLHPNFLLTLCCQIQLICVLKLAC